MRGLNLVAILALLTGCAGSDGPDAERSEVEPGRTARGDSGAEGVDLKAMELLRTPLTFAGQGPESFDLTVPPDIVAVDFTFRSDTGFQQSGLRIELTKCGTYDTGTSFWGSTGSGVTYSGRLCRNPPTGPATVSISATLLVFDGTFVLTGFTPVDSTPSAANVTTAR